MRVHLLKLLVKPLKVYILRRVVYIFGVLFVLFACDHTNSYKVSGRLSNLIDMTLYVVYESSEKFVIDTVVCNEKGKFSVFYGQDDDLQAITVYYNDREQWFTLYPEIGEPVRVKGDARYPLLLDIRGGRVNDKLSEFKKKAKPILKELSDLQVNMPVHGEEAVQRTNLNLEMRKSIQDFVAKNPKEKASAALISEYYTKPDEIEIKENLLNLLSPELDDYILVKNIRKEIEKAKTISVGAKAPNFNVTNVYGQTFTIDSLANKSYILVFTAAWCDMCQPEALTLDEITTKYAKDSLEIMLISLDDKPDEIRERALQDSIQWNITADSVGQSIRLFDLYNVQTIPKCFLIDKNGIIRLNTRNGEELKHYVDEIMKY